MHKLLLWLSFRMHQLWFRVRDRRFPPSAILEEAGVQPGDCVLDYGCGSGSYSFAAAELVGPSGHVYAADINPFALRHVTRVAEARGLANMSAIQSEQATGLPDGSVDVALLYDTLHDLADPAGVLAELRRVLKPNGVLSFADHHLSEDAALAAVTAEGRFALGQRGAHTYGFRGI